MGLEGEKSIIFCLFVVSLIIFRVGEYCRCGSYRSTRRQSTIVIGKQQRNNNQQQQQQQHWLVCFQFATFRIRWVRRCHRSGSLSSPSLWRCANVLFAHFWLYVVVCLCVVVCLFVCCCCCCCCCARYSCYTSDLCMQHARGIVGNGGRVARQRVVRCARSRKVGSASEYSLSLSLSLVHIQTTIDCRAMKMNDNDSLFDTRWQHRSATRRSSGVTSFFVDIMLLTFLICSLNELSSLQGKSPAILTTLVLFLSLLSLSLSLSLSLDVTTTIGCDCRGVANTRDERVHGMPPARRCVRDVRRRSSVQLDNNNNNNSSNNNNNNNAE
jgi:hypothetical protein